jgi:chorismate synthase
VTGPAVGRPEMTDRHTLRHLETLDDYRACVALQEDTWGEGFSERVPTAILKVAQSLGGVTAGAFDDAGRLVGFVFGLTGLDEHGEVVHWSDMLAVSAGASGAGLGARLKAFQREAVVGRGVRKMFWTFDPLRAANAHLNLNKLGAVVREYRRDMYGDTDSVLHRGIGTDRFVALWLLDSERVVGRMARMVDAAPAGAPPAVTPPAALALTAVGPADLPEPGNPVLDLDEPHVGVAIPPDIGTIIERDTGLAVAWREASREVFIHYLERGYEVVHLFREGTSAPTYLLSRMHPDPPDRDHDP